MYELVPGSSENSLRAKARTRARSLALALSLSLSLFISPSVSLNLCLSLSLSPAFPFDTMNFPEADHVWIADMSDSGSSHKASAQKVDRRSLNPWNRALDLVAFEVPFLRLGS